MRACVIIPAYRAEHTLRGVVSDLREAGVHAPIFVIDDGSDDRTSELAGGLGVRLLRHDYNRGKGAALRTAMGVARDEGYEACLTVDADGQHPASAARAVLDGHADPGALVLGVRDLARAGAPRPNQISNGISNFFLSWFSGAPLADTQCGLRRYPIARTLELRARADRYAFEAEIVLKAVRAGVPIVEVPVDVRYPKERVTHFHSVKDPARIVFAVVRAMMDQA